MKTTNNQGLPQAFVDAVTVKRHNKPGCYSATTLLKGACEAILEKRHFDEIEVDAADSIWTVFGSAVHAIFEKQQDSSFKEEYFEVQVTKDSKVTGRVDCYDLENEILYDWKTASVWKVQFKDFEDWRKQGLIYAWLMEQNNLNVKKVIFHALLKDHSKSKARHDSQYPQNPVYTYTVDVTEEALEEIEKFIKSKVALLEAAETVNDSDLIPCDEKERWASPEKWAVMKNGRKTALKLCDSEEEAMTVKAEKGGDYIEHRPGESRKCEDFCNVCQWCPFRNK